MAIHPTTFSFMSSASLIEHTMQLDLYPVSMLVIQENDPMASGHSALAGFVARQSMAPVSCLLQLLLPEQKIRGPESRFCVQIGRPL